MKLTKVVVSGNLPAGSRVWLSEEQAAARAHAITPVEPEKGERAPGKGRRLHALDRSFGFKAGEELAVEGSLDRATELMFGLVPATVESAAEAAARARAEAERAAAAQRLAATDAARKRVDDAIDAENQASDALDRLKASPSARAEEIAAATDALAAATAEVEAAEKALDALGTA